MPTKTSKTTAAKTQTKADFVRSQPRGMPAKEVIAKAKAAGVSLTKDTIYKTRSLDTVKGKKGDKPASSSSRGKAPDKKGHVLGLVAQHPEWTADQVATAAKCSTTYVYAVWRNNKSQAKASKANAPSNGTTVDFYRAVKKLGGVSKAKELLATIEAYESA